MANSGVHATGNGPAAKLAWCYRLLAGFERDIAVLRRDDEGLAALDMKVTLMKQLGDEQKANQALRQQLAEVTAAAAAGGRRSVATTTVGGSWDSMLLRKWWR